MHGSQGTGKDDAHLERDRTQQLGRCAGVLFLAGALASAPANQLLTNPEPTVWMPLIDLLAALSGVICLLVPWRRVNRRWLHVIPFAATSEIVLTVTALGVHGEVYLWFFLLGAVFTGYAFRRRIVIAAHMAVAGFGFLSTAIASSGWDQDSFVRAMVGIPTLWVSAGIVAWLREGLESREAALVTLARTDALTGLGNRRALMEDLALAVEPGAPPRTFAIFDLDGFKSYNDRHGHPAGDALLERLGAKLAATLAGRGTAYRLGGDEFCVLLEGPVEVATLAACTAALTDGSLGASHGSATLPAEAPSASAALSTADARMYAAKQARRRDTPPFVTAVLRESATPPASPRR
jgi:diguanylate cyclase (GGDEF)-like protein